MFELNGNPVSLEDIQNKANEKGYDVDTYINFLKKQGLVEKTSDVATQDAPVTSTSDMASNSEDISLDSLDPESFLNSSQNLFDTKELEEKDISSYQKISNSFSNALPQLKEAFYGTKGWLIDMAARTAAIPGVSSEAMKEVVYKDSIVNNFKKN